MRYSLTFICLLLMIVDLNARKESVVMASADLPIAMHPERRETPFPIRGVSTQNPSALLWPVERGKNVRYSVRLSQSRQFPRRGTLRADGFPWAFFNPHQKLKAGVWYWQYGVSKNGRKLRWSEVFEFEIKKGARVLETPSVEGMLAGVPAAHPRLWVTADELPRLRKRVKRSAELKLFMRRAKRFVGEDLPADDFPPEKGETEYQKWSYRKWASKALAGGISSSMQWLAPAYLMTGDAQLGEEIRRRALHVANWHPGGFTDPKVSDFADGSCMRILGQAYDTCYDLFGEEERALIRENMRFRADRLFEKMANGLESRVFSAHIWQHILLEFAEVTFALIGEVPEAEQWATYIYGIWLARVPLLGGADGGWANGNNYFRTNAETLLSMPDLFRRLTGVDLFQHPWYENAPDYMMYTWPPGSASDGFGDGGEKASKPDDTRLAFADALGSMFGNGYARWYVDTAREDRDLKLSPMLMWYRLRAGSKLPRAKSPRDLPQAKAFENVGVVAMHSDLSHTDRNLMVAFRSSPFGAFNHMHADQNSFNLLFGGERLFNSSGYYISYNDDHFNGWYKHSRGHNTVLIDGKGQTFGSTGYGWIARFLDGQHISYCLGDASMAYGDAGLTRFRRHVVFLRPQTVVIYDDLEADHPAEWEWLLHGARKLTAYKGIQRLTGRSRTARGQVDVLGSAPLEISISDVFDPLALNWRGQKFKGRVPDEFPRQWHATVKPDAASAACRFLSIIQVRAIGDDRAFDEIVAAEGEPIQMGDWLIDVELNVEKPAALTVRHRSGRVGLVADRPRLVLGKREYRTGGRQTAMLVETGRKPRVLRSRDQRPE